VTQEPGFLSRLFLSGSFAFILIGIVGSIYGVALPAFTRLYGLDEGDAGLILTTNASGAVIAVLAATLGVPGLGARTATAFIAAGTAAIALTPGWPLTLAASTVVGAGFGLIATEVNRTFLVGFGPRGPGMVGLVNGISGIGSIAGPLIFVATGSSIFAVYGALAVLAAALVFSFDRQPPSASHHRHGPVFRQWRTGILILNHVSVCLEAGLAGLGVTALIATGWTEAQAATLAAGFFAALLVSRVALYWLTKVLAPDALFLAGTVGTAACAVLAASGAEAVGFVLAGAFVGIAFPSFFVWGARLLGDDPRISPAILLSGLSGLAIGPFVIGSILHRTGPENLFLVIAIGAGLLALAILAAMRPARRLAAAPA
jgi:hypothetical protein